MKTGCLEEALSQGPTSSVPASHLPAEDMEIEHPVEVDAERQIALGQRFAATLRGAERLP